MSLFTEECCIQAKRSSRQGFSITASWFQCSERKSCDRLHTLTSILNPMSCFGNQMRLPNQSEFTENSTHQRISLRLTVTSRTPRESREGISRGLYSVLCFP